MARGDQARKAAHRQAVAAQAAEESAYQRKIVQLTAELREARETIDRERAAHKKVERRLRAERDEGVAPQVQALKLRLEAEVERRNQAERDARVCEERLRTFSDRTAEHLVSEHRFHPREALELLLAWAGQVQPPPLVAEVGDKSSSVEARRRIDAARGIKHLPNAGTARHTA